MLTRVLIDVGITLPVRSCTGTARAQRVAFAVNTIVY